MEYLTLINSLSKLKISNNEKFFRISEFETLEV